MVGFPTETEQQYLDTEQMVQELDIAFPHVFSYSERSGTPAALIPAAKQVPVAIRKQRNQRLRDSARPLQVKLLASRVGESAWVLPEKLSWQDGYTQCRAEDYLSVLLPTADAALGRWVKVRYSGVENGQLIASEVSN